MDRDDTPLIFRDIPIFLWLFGLIFATVGALIFSQSGLETGVLAMALVFGAVGLGALLFGSVLTITADRITRMLKLEYRSALRHTLKQIAFDEIADFNVERSTSRNGSVYRVVVMRKDGQVIPLRSHYSSGWSRKDRLAGRLRDFVGVQPTQLQEPEIHETGGVHWQVRQLGTGGSTHTRWHSPDFKSPGVFLFVAQKAEGQATGGFLASLGSLFFRQSLTMYGFQPDDTPGVDHAGGLAPLDPAVERHFMAFTNDPASARRLFTSTVVKALADWAGRYPLKQLSMGSRASQLVVLLGPNGVTLATMNRLQPAQVNELAALGVELVKSHRA